MAPGRSREKVFEATLELARALRESDGPETWEPLRDVLLAGLEAGGLLPEADPEAFRRAAGELAAAALATRQRIAGS